MAEKTGHKDYKSSYKSLLDQALPIARALGVESDFQNEISKKVEDGQYFRGVQLLTAFIDCYRPAVPHLEDADLKKYVQQVGGKVDAYLEAFKKMKIGLPARHANLLMS